MSNVNNDKILFDYKDVSTATLIYDLPDIINYNNMTTINAFNHIYNNETGEIRVPVNTSSVDATTIHAANLKVDNLITLSDTNFAIDHNIAVNRDSINSHPAIAISYESKINNENVTNVKNAIDCLINIINEQQIKIEGLTSRILEIEESITFSKK